MLQSKYLGVLVFLLLVSLNISNSFLISDSSSLKSQHQLLKGAVIKRKPVEEVTDKSPKKFAKRVNAEDYLESEGSRNNYLRKRKRSDGEAEEVEDKVNCNPCSY